ncbi:hypothetical protein [uncultured Croceitalea sp.]|uniref:hypothetical protein n=1 Tax=uncultured Croceitalea sp. TaxID=1798908 RepID=UPI00374F52BE
MKTKLFILTVSGLFLITSCKQKENKPTENIIANSSIDSAKVPDNWITKRVTKAKLELKSSEAGKIVWKAMKAHGGLKNWYSKGPISFRFNYQPLDDSTQRDTYQVIDTWRSKARHYHVKDSSAQYGWDGSNAWLKAKDSTVFPYNTRFWSLTPYFFAAQPFVLDGNGVNLELLPQKDHNDKLQNVVKVTFDAGTGDAPDDYYILYFDNQTNKLSVIRYIVSYPGYFKNGGHLPEKLMELNGEQVIDGILFPKSYKTHWLTKDKLAGEHITDISLSTITFIPELSKEHFKIPADAEILEGL